MIKREVFLEIAVVLFLMGIFLPRLTAADPIVYDGGGRRDPFLTLIGSGSIQMIKNKDLAVEGIIYDPPSGSMVLVNGEFYKPGQRVGEATVISIFKDRVVLSQDSEEKTLWIREEIAPKGEHKNVKKKIPAKAH